MGLRLFFLPNFPGAMFIQGATFISDSRVPKENYVLNFENWCSGEVSKIGHRFRIESD